MIEAYQLRRAIRPSEGFCYAIGDAGFNLLWVLYDSFLLYFLLRVAHLPAWSITPIVVCSRGADLVAGLAFGLMGDRIRTRYGTYRPYILVLGVPQSAVFVLLFLLPSYSGNTSSSVIALLTGGTAAVFTALYSVANAAYTALLSVITSDTAVRMRITSLRFAFAAAGVLAVQYLALPMATRLGSAREAHGWSEVAILCATACAVAMVAVVAGTREQLAPSAPSRLDLRRTMRDVAKERGLGWLIAAMFFCLAALSSRGAASPFYLQATLSQASWVGFALAVNSLAAFVVCAIVPALVPLRWLKPLPLACTCTAIGTVLCLMPRLWGATSHWKILILQILFGAGTGLLLPTLFVLLSATRQQIASSLTPALMASVTLLALKAGSAAGALLASLNLTYFADRTSPAGLFTFWPALLFGLTLVCLFAAGSSRRTQPVGEPSLSAT